MSSMHSTITRRLSLSYALTSSPFLQVSRPMLLCQKATPPEALFPGEPLSFPVDIWSLGCAIWNIIGVRPLFDQFAITTDWMITEHVTVLGRLPSRWWEKWDSRFECFNGDGTPRNIEEVGPLWAERLEQFVQEPGQSRGMEEIGNEEKAALLTMLKGMLVFEPGERLTVEQVMESKWIKEWALPELEKIREVQ
ncbi:hypothetical protein AJ80_05122 [Polytolypa hystricis UAMH7299]|uniref:Protein kinase domain-containing protein n=1 Tax=Polytolypa hystricis (strain UAMH7299) TaxID=1447883 RepID=A0A2B7Y5V8_POLH7|nr:hypothetical protein AJ80_05122 [Polytolypa hystricis UAMH7299]